MHLDVRINSLMPGGGNVKALAWTIVNKVDKQNDKIHRKFTSA